MAEYSDQAVNDRINQIIAEKGNTAEAAAQIATEAKAAGVGAAQVARALRLNEGNTITEEQVRERAAAAGSPFFIKSVADRVASGDIDSPRAEQLLSANITAPISAEDYTARFAPPAPEFQLTPDQAAFMTTLPEYMRGDYEELVRRGFGDASAMGVQDIADYLKGRGYEFEDASRVVGLLPEMDIFEEAAAAYGYTPPAGQPGQPGAGAQAAQAAGMGTLVQETTFYQMPSGQIGSVGPGEYLPYGARQISVEEFTELARSQGLEAGIIQEGEIPGGTPQPVPGEYVPFQYTPFTAGGIYGPGQGLPSIFQPAQPPVAPGTPVAPPVAQGPTTMMSPAVTTYSYPSPFSGVNIFERPAPTPYTPTTT